jgi:hypothetical protein
MLPKDWDKVGEGRDYIPRTIDIDRPLRLEVIALTQFGKPATDRKVGVMNKLKES